MSFRTRPVGAEPGLEPTGKTRKWGPRHIIIRGCVSPTVYINGVQLGGVADLEQMITPDNIEALEVHLGAYTVAEYHNYDACGVIAVWTR